MRGRDAYRRGDLPEARQWLEKALVEARAEGQTTLAFEALEVLSNACIADREPERALEAIGEQQRTGTATTAERQFTLNYVSGLALRELGRYHEAVSAFGTAGNLVRAQAPDLARDAHHMQATTHLRLGAGDVAERVLRAVLAEAHEPRERADVLNNLAWAHLLEREAGRRSTDDDPRQRLMEAHALLLALPSTSATVRANVTLNLALEAVQRSDPTAAERWLAVSVGTSTAPELLGWQQDVRGRIAIARKTYDEAARAAAALRALGDRYLAPDWVWRSHLLDGTIAERRRDLAAARAAYGAAEDTLDRIVLGLPSDVGPMPYLDQRWQSAAALFDLERRARNDAAGHRVIRRALRRFNLGGLRAVKAEYPELRRVRRRYELARARMLDRPTDAARAEAVAAIVEYRQLAAEEALSVASAPLRPIADGEAQLTWFRVGADWFRVEQTTTSTAVVGLGPMRDVGRAAWALEGLGPALAHASRARIVAPPAIAELTLHVELLHRFDVTYGLELPPAKVVSDGDLVVAGVSSRGKPLPATLEEARHVCTASGLSCRLFMDGGTGDALPATRARLLAALGQARYFHFAGHGDFSGENGWFSRILLFGADDLTASDITLMQRAPEVVVLGACQTARVASGPLGGGVGIAMAFLVAGSGVVVAPMADVQDDAAAWVANRLQTEGVWQHAASALRRTQRAAQAEGIEPATWGAFRTMGR